MYLIILLNILTLLLFYKSPIRYSSKTIFYKFSHKHLQYLLLNIIIISSCLHYYLSNKNIFIIPFAIIFFIIGNFIKSPYIIDNDNLNPPFNHLSKTNYILFFLTIIIILIQIILLKNINYYLPIFILTIYIYLFIQLRLYSACKYLLPISWNNI